MRKRRCLVPVDGYYEWKKTSSGKAPYRFEMKHGGPFALGGLWEHWEDEGGTLLTCALLTTEPNPTAASVHRRMPVIISPEHYELWMDPRSPKEEVQRLLGPWADDALITFPVSRRVNSPRNDDLDLTRRVDDAPLQGSLF